MRSRAMNSDLCKDETKTDFMPAVSMQNVLIPTDFSGNARNAIAYAAQLLDERHFTFVLLHTYPGVSTSPQDSAQYATKKLKEEVAILQKDYPERHFRVRTEAGDLHTVAAELVRQENFSIVVMGTRGLQKGKSAFWGTHTSKVAENTSCPTIIVPEKASYQPPQQIIFATDFELNPGKSLDFLLDVAERFASRITVLHVLPEDKQIGAEELNGLQLLHERGNRIASHFIRSKNVAEGITDFVRAHRTDMLAVMKHSYGFMEQLFHKSITKELALHADVPILVLHDRK
mgnify:CR=1 FL=1